MPVLAAFALANLKHDIEAVVAWLSHRSFWQLVAMGLTGLLIVQHFQLADARHDRDSYMRQRDGYKAQLDAISYAKDVQRQATRDNIVRVTKIVHDADGVAKRIEQAPPTKDCRTPPEIMGADL